MKKIIIPALILMLGGIVSAFTVKKTVVPETGHLTDQYWHFTGTTSMQESDPSKYDPIDDPDEPGCSTGELRCVILAPPSSGNSNQPDLSTVTVVYTKN